MGFYEDRVLPRIIDVALGTKATDKLRARVCAGLDGDVLEVGFGSGRNVPHYPDGVTRVRAVDPATVGMRLAEKRIAARGLPVEPIGLDGEHLPLDDGSVDRVLVTWTLCTIPDVAGALDEMRRVLRPGGTLHFVEHGHAPDEKVARWQSRLDPMQGRLFGGCHLTRRIDDLIAGAGFDLTRLSRFYGAGPKFVSSFYEGVATVG